MIGHGIGSCAACLLSAADPAEGGVYVLDGPEVEFMRDGLQRAGCAFRAVAHLEEGTLSSCRVLVLSGTRPPLGRSGAEADRAAPRCRRGRPGGWWWRRLDDREPALRRKGPRATSILGCGGPYSIAAFQHVGKGLALLIGADPRGGNAYYRLDRPTPTTGKELKTDHLLANAIASLKCPEYNIVPNAGFEENTDLPLEQSNWRITLERGATSRWYRDNPPEGRSFLQLVCPRARSSGAVEPICPLAVERGARCRLGCTYKASATWTLRMRWFRGQPSSLREEAAAAVTAPPSPGWTRWETEIAVRPDVAYVKPVMALQKEGQLALDEVTARRSP